MGMITAGQGADQATDRRGPLLLQGRAGLRRVLGAFLAFLLDPVHVEGFVLERSGEERGECRRVGFDCFAKSRVGGRDQVRGILSRPVHDLMDTENELVVTNNGSLHLHIYNINISFNRTCQSMHRQHIWDKAAVNKPCQQGDRQPLTDSDFRVPARTSWQKLCRAAWGFKFLLDHHKAKYFFINVN